ncbi:hypothetical protein ACLOJK_029997 [Asimina triloba]
MVAEIRLELKLQSLKGSKIRHWNFYMEKECLEVLGTVKELAYMVFSLGCVKRVRVDLRQMSSGSMIGTGSDLASVEHVEDPLGNLMVYRVDQLPSRSGPLVDFSDAEARQRVPITGGLQQREAHGAAPRFYQGIEALVLLLVVAQGRPIYPWMGHRQRPSSSSYAGEAFPTREACFNLCARATASGPSTAKPSKAPEEKEKKRRGGSYVEEEQVKKKKKWRLVKADNRDTVGGFSLADEARAS